MADRSVFPGARVFPFAMMMMLASAALSGAAAQDASAPDQPSAPVIAAPDLVIAAPETDCDRLSGMPVGRLIVTPDEPGIVFSRGGSADEIDAIIAACRAATAEYPNEARFPYRLGLVLNKNRDDAGAIAAFEAAIALGAPGGFDELATLISEGKAPGGKDKAIALYEQAIARFDHPELKRGLAMVLVRGPGLNRERARQLLDEAAARGHLPAIVDLGMVYQYGRGEEESSETAAQLYETADLLGSSYGAYRAGELYRFGPDSVHDVPKSVFFYTSAAGRGHAGAMYRLGQIADQGLAGSVDRDRGFQHFQEAAARGHIDSMHELGNIFSEGRGRPLDHAQARKWYLQAWQRGYACAGTSIGMQYDHGRGLKQDMVEAFRWYEKSAALNCGSAISNLGYAYQHGRGVPVDDKKAAEYFEQAAKLGNATAMSNIGYAYKHGLMGYEKNNTKARDYYERAVKAGNGTAMNNLGMMYIEGDGVRRDRAKGMELLQRGADQYDRFALNNLAYQYERTDKKKARALYEKAIELGALEAKQNLARLLDGGDKADKARANELRRELAQAGQAKDMHRYAERLDYGRCDDKDLAISGDNGEPAEDCEAATRYWLKKTVAAGEKKALERLAEMTADGEGGPADPTEADRLFKLAIEHDSELTPAYAKRLRTGDGLPPNATEARRLYLDHAGDSEDSAFAAVEMLLAGEGGARDPAGAVELLESLSEDSRRASQMLAEVLRKGDKGVPRDATRARAMLISNLMGGYEPSRLPLADMVLNGEGGKREPDMALTLLQTGSHNVDALLRAAEMLSKGQGVKKDLPGALTELRKVTDRLADMRACLPLAELYSKGVADAESKGVTARFAAESYLCALANGAPEARTALIKNHKKLPAPVRLALKARLAELSEQKLSAGPVFDQQVLELLDQLAMATGRLMPGRSYTYFASMVSGWSRPVIGREAEAKTAAKPENIGWKIAYGLRDAWHVRIRAANPEQMQEIEKQENKAFAPVDQLK